MKPSLIIPPISIQRKVMKASVAVTARLPVTVEPYGMSPRMLAYRMKKKNAMMRGAYFGPISSPMLAMAISFRTNNTIDSIRLANPLGATPAFSARATPRAATFMVMKTSATTTNRNTTCLVGERSSVSGPRWSGSQRGRCHSIPNGNSMVQASAVWWSTISPMSGGPPAWASWRNIIVSRASPGKAGGSAPPGIPSPLRSPGTAPARANRPLPGSPPPSP